MGPRGEVERGRQRERPANGARLQAAAPAALRKQVQNPA